MWSKCKPHALTCCCHPQLSLSCSFQHPAVPGVGLSPGEPGNSGTPEMPAGTWGSAVLRSLLVPSPLQQPAVIGRPLEEKREELHKCKNSHQKVSVVNFGVNSSVLSSHRKPFSALPSLSEMFFSNFSQDAVCPPREACKFSICRRSGRVAEVTLWLSSWFLVSASWSLCRRLRTGECCFY